MRDPNRIDRILYVLGQVWKTMPDMRFFQLVSYIQAKLNVADPFYVEENTLLETLIEMINTTPVSGYTDDVDDTVVIYFDGGSRGNGSADAVGGWAFIDTFSGYRGGGRSIGVTNNEMEWTGLVNALSHAFRRGYKNVHIKGDSQLVVNQFNGKWACNAENLQTFYLLAKNYMHDIPNLTVSWVPREQNPADTEYNRILDAG